MNKAVIYTDGGSRGNPGPAAFGAVIQIGLKIKEYSQYLGVTTNNEAEYQGVVFALKKTKALLGKVKAKQTLVEVFVDSELVAKQLNGSYKIKQAEFFPMFISIWNLRQDFAAVKVQHILRAKNKRADWLVNRELDKH